MVEDTQLFLFMPRVRQKMAILINLLKECCLQKEDTGELMLKPLKNGTNKDL
jgi:hypothetical protein